MIKAQFMQLWDGLSTDTDSVVVMGATNRPKDVDTAILRRMPLTFLSVIFFALRETLGHIICLLISLGYGIVMNVLNKYSTKIGLLSFLFFIAAAIN